MKRHAHLWKLSYTTNLQQGYKHLYKASYGETEPTVKSLWNKEKKTTTNEGVEQFEKSGKIQTH